MEFFSGHKTRRTEFGRQPHRDPRFSDCFWTASCRSQQREDGSTMRYAEALPIDFRFLPGLLGTKINESSSFSPPAIFVFFLYNPFFNSNNRRPSDSAVLSWAYRPLRKHRRHARVVR